MTVATEYRGFSYTIPRNSDGVWTWIIHPHRGRRKTSPHIHPKPTYATRADAIAGVERVIDEFLGESAGGQS